MDPPAPKAGALARLCHTEILLAVNTDMKTAILVTGRPRFSREFDDLLINLKNYDQLDWFFLLWNSDHAEDIRIPPSWPYGDIDTIRGRILHNLPERSNIAHLSIVDPPAFDATKSYNITPWSVAPNIWTMYFGIQAVNDIREQYELKHGPYDLAIRARPDIGVDTPLDLRSLQEQLSNMPPTVVVSSNERHGMSGTPLNDMFGIMLPSTMSTYSRAFENIDKYNAQGLPFHGETVLAHHLHVNNIAVPPTNFRCVGRQYGRNGEPRLGDDSNSDFGRWN